MSPFEERILRLFESIHPLDRIARAGFVLRGVCEPESIAAHSHFVALMALLFAEEYPGQFDRTNAMALALVHDLAEAHLMDIPMPTADKHLREAKDSAEAALLDEMLSGFGPHYTQWHAELTAASTPEARLIRGLDKAQMMIKVVMYQKEGRGRLDEFWGNPKNFSDFGLEPVSRLFDAICHWAGKPRPR